MRNFSSNLLCILAVLVIFRIAASSPLSRQDRNITGKVSITENHILCDLDCYNNGTCEIIRVNDEIISKCRCRQGFYGKQCKSMILEDKTLVPFRRHKKKILRDVSVNLTCGLICFNGGKCELVALNERKFDFKCICMPNFHGKQCKEVMIEYDEYELDHKAKPNDIDEESEIDDYITSKTILFFLIVVVFTLLILIISFTPIIFAYYFCRLIFARNST